jgi:hypothetical protein
MECDVNLVANEVSQHLFLFTDKLPRSASFCYTMFFSLLFINISWVSLYLCFICIIFVYFLVIYQLSFCLHVVLKIIRTSGIRVGGFLSFLREGPRRGQGIES